MTKWFVISGSNCEIWYDWHVCHGDKGEKKWQFVSQWQNCSEHAKKWTKTFLKFLETWWSNRCKQGAWNVPLFLNKMAWFKLKRAEHNSQKWDCLPPSSCMPKVWRIIGLENAKSGLVWARKTAARARPKEFAESGPVFRKIQNNLFWTQKTFTTQIPSHRKQIRNSELVYYVSLNRAKFLKRATI